MLRQGGLRSYYADLAAGCEERFLEAEQLLRNVLPQAVEGVIELQWSMSIDRVLNAVDLAFEVAKPFRQAGDIAHRFNGLDEFRLPPPFLLQLLGQRFNRDQNANSRHFAEPLPNLLLAPLDGRFQNLRAKDLLLNGIE